MLLAGRSRDGGGASTRRAAERRLADAAAEEERAERGNDTLAWLLGLSAAWMPSTEREARGRLEAYAPLGAVEDAARAAANALYARSGPPTGDGGRRRLRTRMWLGPYPLADGARAAAGSRGRAGRGGGAGRGGTR